eukprot:TRINITY_DN6434_c0_g4_i1.p1 TRINITY_DN6434_c0_g4~~TRINITY_DN6434_c0_g4_i1.p1  ORF type:complete len:100 (-),score=19.06 TRINITY_DN6434_c0_g4_i1:22-321(-)
MVLLQRTMMEMENDDGHAQMRRWRWRARRCTVTGEMERRRCTGAGVERSGKSGEDERGRGNLSSQWGFCPCSKEGNENVGSPMSKGVLKQKLLQPFDPV